MGCFGERWVVVLLKVLFFLIASVISFAPTNPLRKTLWMMVDDNARLHYAGADGPAGKHVVLIAAEQNIGAKNHYAMLARVLASHHGFDCTVLFCERKGSGTQRYPFKDKATETSSHSRS